MPLPTPYSYRTYPGDGTTDVFAVPFPYIVRAHVKVYVNWNVNDGLFDAELLDGVGFDWVGDTSINVTTAPIAPDTISVVRLTPVDQRVTQWQAGSPPTAFELTAADEQVLFVVQEFIDRVLATQGTLNFVISDGLTTVVDNLTSTSATSALSANQGRILKGLIDGLDAAVDAIIAGGGGGGGGGSVTVLDILTSTNSTAALSANMGRALKDLIDALDIRVDAAEAQNRTNQAAIFQTQAAILDTAQVPAGTIVWLQPPATPTTPPVGFLYCSGAERSRSEYPELFNAIGTTYGAGDGTTTFNLPLESGLTNPFPGATPAYRPYVRVGLAFPVSGAIYVGKTGTTGFRSASLSGDTFTLRAIASTSYPVEWAAISASAEYAATGGNANNLDFTIWRRTGNSWIACTNDLLPSGEISQGGVFSFDNNFLFVAGATSNHVFTRTGLSTWTRAAIGGPPNRGTALSISRTGRFITAGANGQPFAGWEITSTGIQFLSANLFPGAIGRSNPNTGWGPGDNLVALCSVDNLVYARSGVTFAPLLSQPSVMLGEASLMQFSPDGLYLIGSTIGTPAGFRLWKFNGTTFELKNTTVSTGAFFSKDTFPIPGRARWTIYSFQTEKTYGVNTTNDTFVELSTTNGLFSLGFSNNITAGLVP